MDLILGDGRPSATFNFVVRNFTRDVREDGIDSLPCMIRNIPWKLKVCKNGDTGKKTLGIYLQCLHCMADEEEESECSCDDYWTCSAKIKIILLNSKSENLVEELDHVFHSEYQIVGFDDFIAWNKVTDPRNGYIDKNTVCIRAEVAVSVPLGIDVGLDENDESYSMSVEHEKKIELCESELRNLKADLHFEKRNVLNLQKELAGEKSKVSLLQIDLTCEKSKLSLLQGDVANEKAIMRSEINDLKTVVDNLKLQISEMKKVSESVPNASTNSSTGDLRAEVREVLLSLLSPK